MKKITKPLTELLEASVKTDLPDITKVEAKKIKDPIEFNFDIEILKVKGKLWKSGKLEYTASVFGIEVSHTVIDITKEVCFTLSVGFEEIHYCFYRRDSCLRTKGYVDGWFHEKQPWDAKIVCF